jgi:hypothetical protein
VIGTGANEREPEGVREPVDPAVCEARGLRSWTDIEVSHFLKS